MESFIFYKGIVQTGRIFNSQRQEFQCRRKFDFIHIENVGVFSRANI